MTQIDHSKLKAKPHEEDFAGKYENNGFIARTLVENYFKSVNKLLQKTSNIHNAHEIGAGEGRSTSILSKMVNNISASEFVEELVAKAKVMNPSVAIFQESVYELKYEKDSVDLIFLLEVLEHLDYPEKALQEIKRVSKKYLILGVPREPLWCFLNMCRLKYLKDFGNTPGHLNHWTKKKIIKLVEKEYGKVIAVESPIPWTILLAIKKE